MQGVRIGVRIGEEPSAKIVIDVQGDALIAASYAKPLILQFMSDRGMAINDVYSWTAKTEGERNFAGRQALEDRLAAADERDRFARHGDLGGRRAGQSRRVAGNSGQGLVEALSRGDEHLRRLKADMKDIKNHHLHCAVVRQIRQADREAARSQRGSRAAAIQRLCRQPISRGVDVRQDDGNPVRRSPSTDHKRRFGYGGDYNYGGYRYGATDSTAGRTFTE